MLGAYVWGENNIWSVAEGGDWSNGIVWWLVRVRCAICTRGRRRYIYTRGYGTEIHIYMYIMCTITHTHTQRRRRRLLDGDALGPDSSKRRFALVCPLRDRDIHTDERAVCGNDRISSIIGWRMRARERAKWLCVWSVSRVDGACGNGNGICDSFNLVWFCIAAVCGKSFAWIEAIVSVLNFNSKFTPNLALFILKCTLFFSCVRKLDTHAT